MKGSMFEAIMFWLSVQNKYEKLKNDPQKRETSVTMGVQSLIMSIVGVTLTVLAAFGTYKCFTLVTIGSGMSSPVVAGLAGIFVIIGGALCALFALGVFIYLVVASIVYAIYQMKLNKKPIGLVSLIISIVLIVGTIVAVIVLLSVISSI